MVFNNEESYGVRVYVRCGGVWYGGVIRGDVLWWCVVFSSEESYDVCKVWCEAVRCYSVCIQTYSHGT